MNVLGLKVVGHDTGAALISNGKVVAIAEERLNRIKYAHGCFPNLSIKYCLDAMAVNPEDVGLVVIDRMLIEKGGETSSVDAFLSETKGAFKKARIVTANHHDAHAASAFFCSPFTEAAILVYDGNGEVMTTNLGVAGTETETSYYGSGTTLNQIHKSLHAQYARRFPYTMGIGKVYSTLSGSYLGFGAHNEGKMMGLAAYGDDSLLRQFSYERWCKEYYGVLVCNGNIEYPKRSVVERASKAGGYRLFTVAYYGARSKVKRLRDSFYRRIFTQGVENVFRKPDIFEPVRLPRPPRDAKNDTLPGTYYSSVAYLAQKIFERFAIDIGKKLKAITRSENLCIAGGCGLNIDANRNFLTEVGFKNLFVQPASSDCGIALGCALWGCHVILKQPRNWVMKTASLGRPYSDAEIAEAVEKKKGQITWHTSQNVAEESARLIADNNIVGWFQGGSEYGPRALGNRSILCDARNKDMRDILNKRVKHREMWRPFATSILAEKLQDWFELEPSVASAFMLLAAPVRKERQKDVPSIVHVDGTCRMQTLTEQDNGIYYRLVREFEKLTNVPLILNTSFNLGGDPIVETPTDALDTFLRTDMDYLVLEDWIIQKRA